MTDALVIGYGNTLRGDDGLGWIAAEQLQQPAVTVLTCQQLTVELVDAISRAGQVILIDAAVGDSPGTVTCRDILPDPDQMQSLLHHMKPEALLASVQALYGSVPRTRLWTVIGESFAYGEGLSPVVQAALPDLLADIRAALV